MSKRSRDWNEELANDLKDIAFAQEFVLAALEEGISLQQVLAKMVRSYGVKEYADLAKMPSSNLLRAISPDHNPTQSTLNKILKPLDLELTVAPIRDAVAA